MKRISYSRYTGELADDIDLEDLMQQLSDYFLDSGFENQLMRFQELDGEKSLENLREALRQALEYGDFEKQIREQLDQMAGDPDQVDQLIEKLMRRMEQQDYIRIDQPDESSKLTNAPGQTSGEGESQARFEVTDKSLDFLGYKTAARSARVAGTIERGAARYSVPGDGGRDEWVVAGL